MKFIINKNYYLDFFANVIKLVSYILIKLLKYEGLFINLIKLPCGTQNLKYFFDLKIYGNFLGFLHLIITVIKYYSNS